MTQETVSPRGGSQAVRAAHRGEAALLGEVLRPSAHERLLPDVYQIGLPLLRAVE